MPTANPADKKLAGILKVFIKGTKEAPARQKVEKDFQAVRSRVADTVLGAVLDSLFRSLSAPADQSKKPEAAQATATVRALYDRQFVLSAAVLFIIWQDVLSVLPLESILPVTPNEASFEVWRKTSASPAKEIEQRLLASPAATYVTAGADWLLLRVPPEKQLALLELFLTRQPRPNNLPVWSEALAIALQKDKRGALFRAILRNSWPAEDRISALVEVIRGNPVLMKAVIDALPQILTAKEPPSSAMVMVRQLFVDLTVTTYTARQFATASLARLGTGILLHHDIGPCAREALVFIQQTARQLRGATRDADTQSRTWVLENLREEMSPADGRLHITLDGARRFAIAFEKAAQDFPAAEILAMTARNLGLTPIGAMGQTVSYDPLQHEDVDSGMIPGESVFIESQGWSHGENVILRARVRKAKE
jgi:hypothetical protein